MPRAKKICAKPGCPAIAVGSWCAPHQAEAEKARGSREARGYGHRHRELRKQWASKVAAGQTLCARCNQPITADQPWHLDHDDADRGKYLGASHATCNAAAGGRQARRRTTP